VSKKLILLIVCIFQLTLSYGQGWERLMGTPRTDVATAIASATDGGYLSVGYKLEATGNKNDILIYKTDAEGQPQWSKTFGTAGITELGYGILANPDGSFLVMGTRYTDTANLDGQAWVFKINSRGDILWSRSFFSNLCTDIAFDAKRLKNGSGYIITGKVCTRNGEKDDIFLLKLDNNGNSIWQKTYGNLSDFEFAREVVETSDGGFIVAGVRGLYGADNERALVLKTDGNGNALWLRTFGNFDINDCTAILPNSEGGCYVTGVITFDSTRKATFLKKYLADGREAWTRYYEDLLWSYHLSRNVDNGFTMISGNLGGTRLREFVKTDSLGNITLRKKIGIYDKSDELARVVQTQTGFTILGRRTANNNTDYHLTHLDLNGDFFPLTVSGKVYHDKNTNCRFDNTEPALTNWLLKAEGNGRTLWGWTDSTGNYTIGLDSSIYHLSVMLPNNYWLSCQDSILVTLNSQTPKINQDFAIKTLLDCPLLEVDISTPLLRRCFENTYQVQYCNRGTAIARNAYVNINLDKYLFFGTSSIPLSNRTGNILTFNIGDVASGNCGGFNFTAVPRCDSTYLGQTHCVEAHIYPDAICLPTNNWSGASIEVTGNCERDSVSFLIKNTGTNTTANPIKHTVIEDNVVFLQRPIILRPQEASIIKLPAIGTTYRLISDQEPNHPLIGVGGGRPTAVVEGCRSNPNLPRSLGFVTQFDENDGDPFTAIDCRQNIGAYDPNDKQAHPQGIGNLHFIDENAEIDYTIRFQNTGTDTAFTVVIKDTLSQLLDITTLKAGASSHRYSWEILEGKILKFTFKNINLVDSFRNKLASQGFVKFRIRLKSGIPFNSLIENKAAIYFDFNAPIITNRTFHTLRKPERYYSRDLSLCFGSLYNGVIYANNKRVYDTLKFNKFDSIVINYLKILPTYSKTIDTTVARGQNFQGTSWSRDTSITRRFQTKAGCDSTITYRVRVVTGLRDFEKIEVKIYPNPFYDKTLIELPPQYSGVFELKLYDISGRLLLTKTTNNNQFIIEQLDLSRGVFLFEVKKEGVPLAVGKLMKTD
jgi:uncharacterized repeat protein (TIGR01451 family)